VANRLKESCPLDVAITFLGAMTSRGESRDEYMDCLVEEMLPLVAGKETG